MTGSCSGHYSSLSCPFSAYSKIAIGTGTLQSRRGGSGRAARSGVKGSTSRQTFKQQLSSKAKARAVQAFKKSHSKRDGDEKCNGWGSKIGNALLSMTYALQRCSKLLQPLGCFGLSGVHGVGGERQDSKRFQQRHASDTHVHLHLPFSMPCMLV